MADKHPYTSGTTALTQVLDHLKKSFPVTVDAEVLKKLGFAPGNESYIINILRFTKLIDEKGSRTQSAQKTFTLHDPAAFASSFADIVKAAYTDLFKLHGDAAWDLSNPQLITYFRQADQSSELVGTRQANTFKVLASYAGKSSGSTVPAKPKGNPPKRKASTPLEIKTPATDPKAGKGRTTTENTGPPHIGLTVRIEINLPSTGDQETYDKIFKSIRENFLNG